MTAWFSEKECTMCGSLLATDGKNVWCVNDCETNKQTGGMMIYGQWVEWEEDEHDEL